MYCVSFYVVVGNKLYLILSYLTCSFRYQLDFSEAFTLQFQCEDYSQTIIILVYSQVVIYT